MAKPSIIHQIHALAEGNGRALRQTMAEAKKQLEGLLPRLPDTPFKRIYVLGCGTSYYGAVVCKHAFEELAGIPTEGAQGFAFASYQNPLLLDKQTLVVGFSTAGQTEAILNSFAKARERGACTMAATALPESRVAKAADEILLTGATDEVNMPRTKAQSQGLLTFYLLALYLGHKYGTVSDNDFQATLSQLERCIDAVVEMVEGIEEQIKQLGETYRDCTSALVLASGYNTGTAQTGALMITEMAKVHSWGDELENFLHGRFREVDQTNPLLILAPTGAGSARTLDFLTVTDHVGGPTVVFTDEPSEGIRKLATHVVKMPGGLREIITPILYITPLHMFGNYLAVARGTDPNKRRYPDIVPTTSRYKSG
jgi:glucosamine 6-phosphate synthetase-like amidotransferase/phosphosugar isomerase protein